MQQIRLARRGSDVKRYHTWPIIGEQTNGHHVYNMVAMLLTLHPAPSIALIRGIMLHDTPEERFGDAPSPGLWANPQLKVAYDEAGDNYLSEEFAFRPAADLSASDQCWLLALDKLEAFYFAQHQMKLGNFYAKGIVDNLIDWFGERIAEAMIPAPVIQVFETIQDEIYNGS